jgi:hypothetical protein
MKTRWNSRAWFGAPTPCDRDRSGSLSRDEGSRKGVDYQEKWDEEEVIAVRPVL